MKVLFPTGRLLHQFFPCFVEYIVLHLYAFSLLDRVYWYLVGKLVMYMDSIGSKSKYSNIRN